MPATALYASNGGKPKFNEFMTPHWHENGKLMAGRVVHSYHDKPQLEVDDKTQKPALDSDGIQRAQFKVTLAWPKAVLETHLIPMRQMAASTRDEAWGPDCVNDPWFRLEPFLRDGDNPEHNTKRKDYLMGMYYMNFKAKATPIKEDGVFRGNYSGAPQLIGVYNQDLSPTDFYTGCYARVSGIMFGTEYMGRKFISTRLNNIQMVADGERMGGGGRPDAKSQFDPLATNPNAGAFGASPLGSGLGGIVL